MIQEIRENSVMTFLNIGCGSGDNNKLRLKNLERGHLICLEWRYSAVAIATKSSAIFSVAGELFVKKKSSIVRLSCLTSLAQSKAPTIKAKRRNNNLLRFNQLIISKKHQHCCHSQHCQTQHKRPPQVSCDEEEAANKKGQSTNVDENLSVENQGEDVEVQDIDHNINEGTA
ncbi:5460_t:CDS:2 [Entrophospora sp. SA101]|nr:5460_t:CDS:2 [Entrophospora sp. SA101]